MQRVLVRYFSYALGVGGLMTALIWLGGANGLSFDLQLPGVTARTSELSPVELTQNALLTLCAALFGLVAYVDRLRRPMAVTLLCLMVACLIRELDFFLDFYVIDNLWQVLCALLVSGGLVYGVRHRARFTQGWRRSWPSAGLAMIMAGFILLVPLAQLVGHEALWRAILGADYLRLVKVAAEEFVELGAYLVITIGTIEFVYAWSRLPRRRHRKVRGRG